MLNGVAGTKNCTRAAELATTYVQNYGDWDVYAELAARLLQEGLTLGALALYLALAIQVRAVGVSGRRACLSWVVCCSTRAAFRSCFGVRRPNWCLDASRVRLYGLEGF